MWCQVERRAVSQCSSSTLAWLVVSNPPNCIKLHAYFHEKTHTSSIRSGWGQPKDGLPHLRQFGLEVQNLSTSIFPSNIPRPHKHIEWELWEEESDTRVNNQEWGLHLISSVCIGFIITGCHPSPAPITCLSHLTHPCNSQNININKSSPVALVTSIYLRGEQRCILSTFTKD